MLSLYINLHDEIYACDLQPTDTEIKMADGTPKRPYGMVSDIYVILGTFTYQVDFVVMEIPEDDFCPIIFGRPFVKTVGASIDCKRGVFSLKCGE